MKLDINYIINYYEHILGSSLDSKGLDEYIINKDVGIKVFEHSFDVCNEFFSIIKGLERKKYPDLSSLCFPQRFLNVDTIGDIGIRNVFEIDNIIMNCFYFGLFFHFIYMRFPTRQNINIVDFQELFNEWIYNTLVADVQMSEYNKKQNNIPTILFTRYYKDNKYDEQFKKVFKIGFMKRSKVFSFFKNIFFAGTLFAMFYDLRTK